MALETFSYQNLFFGEIKTEQDRTLVQQDAVLEAGTVLAVNTVTPGASYQMLDVCNVAGTTTGLNTPYGILLDAVDATADDVDNVPLMVFGEVNRDKLVFAIGTTADEKMVGKLRNIGIYAKVPLSAANADKATENN